MTDANALSELVRVGLRNPARIVVRVQSKKTIKSNGKKALGEVIEERRIPAKYVNSFRGRIITDHKLSACKTFM